MVDGTHNEGLGVYQSIFDLTFLQDNIVIETAIRYGLTVTLNSSRKRSFTFDRSQQHIVWNTHKQIKKKNIVLEWWL